jgi:hypothetical protein
MSSPIPWHSYLVVYRPRRILARLAQLVVAGVIPRAPTVWQVELGVLRMWSRVLFRSGTVGTCTDHPVRSTWRARVLQYRLIRGVFLFWERAIAPLDHSGLIASDERLMRHLLAAHHDQHQFAYDLEMLRATPGALADLRARTLVAIEGTTRRARWLRDLCVYERYHDNLLVAVDAALAGEPLVAPDEVDDPDIGFTAYMRWCCAQPSTLTATWRAWRAGVFPAPPALPNEVQP